MRNLLTTLFLLVSLSSFSQKKDTLVRYFSVDLEPVKKKQAVFIGVAIKDPFGWSTIIYNDSMKVIMRGKYKDPDCLIKDGWFIYYNQKGERSVAGKFTGNLKSDLWQTWYPSGRIKDSIYFANDMANGASRKYFENGLLEAKGFYKNGIPDSTWEWYHENGRKATLEKYTEGLLASFECFDSSGNSLGMNCAINRLPAIKGKYGGVEKYVTDSLKFPEKLNLNDVSFITIQFTVNKEGVMSTPNIIGTQLPTMSDEVLRVVKSIPGWYPAVLHNRTIDYTYTLSISFLPDFNAVRVQAITNPYQVIN
ncbi:MAG TPA: hypothetical protein VK166_01195 [Chitinophagaceae bacterium]|nr:hypothetical protein [Chitinophagaceae bacterium]